MPPRIKSCLNCRIARAKCSLSDPCSRCTKRNLECQYPRLQSTCNRRVRSIKPALSSGTRADQARPASLEASYPEADLSMAVTSTNTPVPDWLGATDTSRSQLPCTSHIDSANSSAMLSPFSIDPALLEASLDVPLSPLWFECLDFTSASRISDEIGDLEVFTQLAMPHQCASLDIVDMEIQLRQRTRSIQQGSLTAKMVFSKLSDYTRMLADGRELPPFMFPPCYARPNARCHPGSPHQCLSETLATCAKLTRMFLNCRPESRGYAWHQVRLHLQHLYADFEADDIQRLLEAKQAAVIYGWLCAQYSDYIPKDDAAWLVKTIEAFGFHLFGLCPWVLLADHVCSSRNEWILMESMRRIASVIYLYDLVLQATWKGPSSGKCPEFFEMPLPSTRELWQAVTDEQWSHLYYASYSTSDAKPRIGLIFGHLGSARRASLYGEYVESEVMRAVTEWCEKADDLNMLLWIALTVEGEGQLPGLSRTLETTRIQPL